MWVVTEQHLTLNLDQAFHFSAGCQDPVKDLNWTIMARRTLDASGDFVTSSARVQLFYGPKEQAKQVYERMLEAIEEGKRIVWIEDLKAERVERPDPPPGPLNG